MPLVALLFAAPLCRDPFWLAGIVLAGTVGFAAVGTLFAAMLVRARSRDVLLPVLLYPVVVPVLIAGVRGTSALVAARVRRRASCGSGSLLLWPSTSCSSTWRCGRSSW